MLENSHFSFNGISSRDMGVQLVHPSGGGLYRENFLPTRRIVETTVSDRNNPFFQRVDEDPLSLSLIIYLEDWENRNNMRQLGRWLRTEYYKPLIFESNPDIIYYAMVTDRSEITHNGLYQGYISLTFRMDSPYMYSDGKSKFLSVVGANNTRLYNNGDLPMRVSFDATKTNSDGRIVIASDNMDEELVITDIKNGETVYVDADNEIITSSMEEDMRYIALNHNDVWITVEPEDEVWLGFSGYYDITLKFQYAYLNTDIEMGNVGVC